MLRFAEYILANVKGKSKF